MGRTVNAKNSPGDVTLRTTSTLAAKARLSCHGGPRWRYEMDKARHGHAGCKTSDSTWQGNQGQQFLLFLARWCAGASCMPVRCSPGCPGHGKATRKAKYSHARRTREVLDAVLCDTMTWTLHIAGAPPHPSIAPRMAHNKASGHSAAFEE